MERKCYIIVHITIKRFTFVEAYKIFIWIDDDNEIHQISMSVYKRNSFRIYS